MRITSSCSAFRILIEPFLYCLALDPAVIATGFEQDGQAVQTAGQVASLTSSNNFINFCLTVPNLPITNGQQIKTGSCNPAPMGVIAATTNIPSSKFVSPVNGQDIAAANAPFTITMAIQNLETGNFVNAASNYYSAPQQVNGQGNIVGHTHFTVQAIPSFTSTTPLDASTFAFFKGVNQAATNGQLSEDVTAGLAAGFYRVCSINTDANHAPCLVAVAQHGNMDDCVYVSSDVSIHLTYRLILLLQFSVGQGANNGSPFGGAAANNATGAGTNNAAGSNSTAANNGAGSKSAATSSAAAAASSAASTAAAGKGAGNGGAGSKSTATSSAAAAASSTAAAGKGAGNGGNQAGNGNKGGKGGRFRLGRQSRLGRDY